MKKSKKNHKKNLLLAATLISMSTTIPMNVVYADEPTPTRGANAAYTITAGSESNYNFKTSDGTNTQYWLINLTADKLNGQHVTFSSSNNGGTPISISLPNGKIQTLYYTYTKPTTPVNYDIIQLPTKDLGTFSANEGNIHESGFGVVNNPSGNNITLENKLYQNNKLTASTNDRNVARLETKYLTLDAGNIHNEGTIESITADFINNQTELNVSNDNLSVQDNRNWHLRTYVHGGAIYNKSNIGDITGDFIGNSVTINQTYEGVEHYAERAIARGGAIYTQGGTTIGNITGDFINNSASANIGTSEGGAIYNFRGTIGNITGNVIGNSATEGGFIFNKGGGENYKDAIIGDITGNFINNSSKSYGSVIYNQYGKIGNITGDFINNVSNSGDGAIYSNYGEIKDITGDFISNLSALNLNQSKIGKIKGNFIENRGSEGAAIQVSGGYSTIESIEGNFIGNYYEGSSNKDGGAINNSSGEIGNITADFIGNYVKNTGSTGSANGGAIYDNWGTLGDITGNFIGNYVDASTKQNESYGGAIFFQNSKIGAKVDDEYSGTAINGTFKDNSAITGGGAIAFNYSTVGDIAANFENNRVLNEEDLYAGAYDVYGGAIYSGDSYVSIKSITGDFTNNSAKALSGNAYGGAIYNDRGSIGTIKGNFSNNSVEANAYAVGGGFTNAYARGGAIYSTADIALTDSSFTNNSAVSKNSEGASSNYSYGGAVYMNGGNLVINAVDSAVSFEGNSAYQGSAIYNNNSSKAITLNALNNDITFTNNNQTGAEGGGGYGIYTNGALNLNASDGKITINDRLYANGGMNINDGTEGNVKLSKYVYGYANLKGGTLEVADRISGNVNLYGGTIKFSENALTTDTSTKSFSLGLAGNSILDMQNNTAGEVVAISNLSGNSELKFNADYDATTNKMDKLTVNGGSGTITLNAVNVLNDDVDFEDETQTTYLDGTARDNVTVITSAINSTTVTSDGKVYVFAPLATHGLLSVTRGINYNGNLIDAIQDRVGTTHPTAFTMKGDFTAETENFGALNTDNREAFTIFGNNHTISGGNTYTGIEVANGQTLGLDSVIFSNVKDYDVQNAGTLNLSGSNIINTITDAETPVGTTNINGGKTTIASGGSLTQNIINMNGGKLFNRGSISAIITGLNDKASILQGNEIRYGSEYRVYNYGGAISNYGYSGYNEDNLNNPTISSITGKFKGNGIVANNPDVSEISSIYSYGGAVSNLADSWQDMTSTITSINADFINNYIEDNSSKSSVLYGGAISNVANHHSNSNSSWNSVQAIITSIEGDFEGNHLAPAENSQNDVGAYGGAIANISSTDRDSSHTWHGTQLAQIGSIEGSFTNNYVKGNKSGYAQGGAIYNDAGWTADWSQIGDITGNFTGNYATSEYNGSFPDIQGGAIYNYGKIGNITGNFDSNWAKNDVYKKGDGGAIYNRGSSSKIESITGNFTSNEAYSGGAIYNYYAEIGDIKGDFILNKSLGTSIYNNGGGAISNVGSSSQAKIGNISGIEEGSKAQFTSNTAENRGGAIYNYQGNIASLNADFTTNSSKNYGGAIYNLATYGRDFGSDIGAITGKFEGNRATSTVTTNSNAIAYGGAIFNQGYHSSSYDANATITSITGSFVNNYAKASNSYNSSSREAKAMGGAIYNTTLYSNDLNADANNSIIGAINADFTGNYVEALSSASAETNARGGAIYNEDGSIASLTGTFSGNYAKSNNGNAYGGAIFNYGVIGDIENDVYGISNSSFTGNYVDSSQYAYGGAIVSINDLYVANTSFTNNEAKTSGEYETRGGAIYVDEDAALFIGTVKNSVDDTTPHNIVFRGNKAQSGAAIYTEGSATISAVAGNILFENNNLTGTALTESDGSTGIYTSGLNLVTLNGYNITINDDIAPGDLTVQAYDGDINLNGNIRIGEFNPSIMFGVTSETTPPEMTGKLVLGQSAANSSLQGLGLNENGTLSLQNNHAGDVLDVGTLSYGKELKFNVDFDASTGDMDKMTVSGVQPSVIMVDSNPTYVYPKLTLNAVNILVDGEENSATYLDGEARQDIVVRDTALSTATDSGWLYTFTPDSTTHGLLSVARRVRYDGTLIDAIQNRVIDEQQAPDTYSLSQTFTATEDFGALQGASDRNFTIFGNNNTISGDNKTYTGIEVASGQTLNLDNVTFSNVKDYDVQNAGTLNLSGSNTINTITGATGNTNITGGLTTISSGGSVTQNAVNMHGGGLKIGYQANVNKIVGDENYTGSYIVAYGGSFSSLEGTFKGSNTYRALDYNDDTALTIDGVTFDSNAAGAIYHSWSGAVDSSISNSTFTNNSTEYEGGAYYQSSTNAQNHTVSFDNVTFTSNSAANKGGAIYATLNAVNNLNISDSTFTSNTVTGANGTGSAIYLEGDGIGDYEPTPSSYTINNSTFTSNGAGGVVYANGGDLTVKNSTFTSNSGDAIVLADNYQYWTIIGGQIAQVYSPITANIVAETGNVAITDNSGWGIVGNKNHETDSALTLYAKSGNITINGNTAGGINNNGLVLTLNADTGHNITVNDAVSSTTGMTINAGGTHAGTIALNGALTLGGDTNIQGGTLKLGTAAAGSAFNNVAFANNPTLDLQNTTADTMVVDKITGNSNLNIDVNSATSVSDAIQIATAGSSGTLTVNSLSFLDDVTTPESFNINVITKGAEGDISGITLAISSALATEYSGTPTATDYDKPYTYNSNITFDTTKFTTEKWTKTTQKQLTVTNSETAKGLKLNVNKISDVHKQDGEGHYIYDTNYDALQVLNQHEGTRTLKADGATANTYTVGDNLGTTATGTLNVTGKSSGSNLDMNSKTGFVVSNADTTLNLTNLNITNINDTQDGGLINLTGDNSVATLNNVTVGSTTKAAIVNDKTLNLNGNTILNSSIKGTGTTYVAGTVTANKAINQNVTVQSGQLAIGASDVGGEITNNVNFLTGNGISLNAGTLNNKILTGMYDNGYYGSQPTGATILGGNVIIGEGGSIVQAAIELNGHTLTGNADSISAGINAINGGKLELTGGTFNNDMYLGNIVFKSGETTTVASKISNADTITNNATLLLSGTLDKAIAGASGITKIDSNLKMTSTGSIEGTLALNGCNLDLSGDGAATQYTVNTLDESGHLKIDIDYSGATPIADSINIATTGGAGSVQLIDITEIGTAPGSFTVEVLKGNIGAKTLEISDSLAERYRGVEETTITYESDDYSANINFDKTTFETREYTEKTQKTLSVVDNTKLKLDKVVTEAKLQTGVVSKDALAFINQNTDTSAVADRSMVTSDTNKTYTVQENLGATGAGTLLVQGASDGTTKLDMNNKTGFVVSNSGTTVTLKDINVNNVQNSDGALVNITNTGSSATLDGVTVNVKDNPENKANVISSNGTLGVTNSTVNAGVNNNGTMNLNGTNQIASVEGSNGTSNFQTGTTTVGSIFQKLINIVTGGKLASNGDVTATNGITNDTANGLSVANGTLTGNVTGTGTTKFSGTSSIANGSSVGQAITVVDGKLTTLADGLGGAVTSAGEVDLTGGTLETSITGGNTTISGNVGVDDTNGLIASAVKVETGAKLTTNASNVTGAINNGGDLDLTGGDIKNTISGDGTTTISGTVTNTTGSAMGNAVTVATTGNLTTAADKLGGAVENNGTTNGLTLTGGQLSQNVTGTGKTVIAGTDVSVKYGNSIAQDIEITSGNKLVNTNVSAIGGDVENNGDIQLYSQDNGKLEHDITGTGTTELNRDITVAANIDNTINIKSYTDGTGTHNANVTVESGNNFGKAGQNITVDSNNSLTMQSASDIKGNLVDNGTVELQGGTILNAISGTGDVNITGNTTNNAANTVTGTVSVAENVELAIGTSGNTFNSASSLTMGKGSTLNLQNGATTNAVMDNLVIATGDNVNVKMDWNDTLNSSSSNIGGSLTVTDINMATSTSSYEATSYAFTNLGNKVALSDPVSLSNVSEATNNFVSYNNITGQLTSFRNSLMRAVDKTEAGETATYVMTGDETAGDQTLEGKLLVQGNGNTIITSGVKVQSSTAAPAELTLQDTNMNVAGKAIEVTGNNKVIVEASAHDITLQTTDSSEVVSLNTSSGAYAQAEFKGANTITVTGDIKSDDVNNTLTIASGATVNHAGLLDPITTNVDGTYNRTSGYDESVSYNINEGGTLIYTNDSILYDANYHTLNTLNTINFNGGTLDTRNGVATDFSLAGLTLNADSNFYGDVDLANKKMDNFVDTPVEYEAGRLHVAGLNLISDAAETTTLIPFASGDLKSHVDYTGEQELTALSPIYKYNVGYNGDDGKFQFTRFSSGGHDDYNPAILAAPVAAQLGGYLTQLNSYEEAFRNMDMYMLMTSEQRQAMKFRNQYAAADGDYVYDSTLLRQENPSGWARPYATFERVGLKHGPKVSNVMYGSFFGGESQMYDLGHGWDGMFGAYAGYNGSHQAFHGISIYQNGGTLGALGMAYKGNFFTGLTINVGANAAEASSRYGNDNFAMLMAGIASKTGYNWELADGRFIIQPSMLMSYSFVNTFDYTNAAGVRVKSDPLHAIQIQPELKFIGNLENGWQPYASVAMVWNVIDDTKFKANNVSLPEMSVKPYVKYGVGARKTWGETFTGYLQTYLTNGGRNGVGLQAGFTWAFGGGKDKKSR